MIYCIGDSHVSFFSGQNQMVDIWPYPSNDTLKFFKTYRIGAVLAYSLSKYNTSLKGREIIFTLLARGVPEHKRAVPSNSRILMCFGEIDCRAHIKKQAMEKNKPIGAVVAETVESYFKVLKEIQDLGFDVNVWNVVPNSGDSLNPEFPSVGSLNERLNIVNEYNTILQKKCEESGMKFYSIYKELYDQSGVPNKTYYLDSVHLSQKAMDLVQEKYHDDFNFEKKTGTSTSWFSNKFFLK